MGQISHSETSSLKTDPSDDLLSDTLVVSGSEIINLFSCSAEIVLRF